MISPSAGKPNQMRQPTLEWITNEMKRTDTQILAMMDAGQKARLKEIGYQYAGGFGLMEPAIAKTLGLTPDQLQKIGMAARVMSIKHARENQNLVKPGSIVNQPHDPKVVTRLLAASRAKMEASFNVEAAKFLTRPQLAQWNRMKGRPFPVATLYYPVINPAGVNRTGKKP
jgi:hypothetical protein